LGSTAGTAWAAEGFDPGGDALLAGLDPRGRGALGVRELERFLRRGRGTASALGALWRRLRAGVEASAKHSCEALDVQLFAKCAVTTSGGLVPAACRCLCHLR
jgi:hypothetical protein